MKKTLLILTALCYSTMLFADGDRPVKFEELPAKARQFVKQHFPDSKVALATVDRGLSRTYDLLFTDGCKIEFDSAGDWKEIECKSSPVPEGAIPQRILGYVREYYPDNRVKKIDRDRRGFEVKLDNGLELKFDRNETLVGYDD